MLSNDVPAGKVEVYDGQVYPPKSIPNLRVDFPANSLNSVSYKGSLTNVASGDAEESTCLAPLKAGAYGQSLGRPLPSHKFCASRGSRL